MKSNESKLQILIPRSEIEFALNRLAIEIARDYKGKNPLIIGILKGVVVFMADLIRLLDFPIEVEFQRLRSYGNSSQTSGQVKVLQMLCTNVKGRHVLLLEDIVDTGLTLAFFIDYLKKREPSSLKLCALLDKPARRKVQVPIDYLGFTVPNKFIVGYGLDLNEKYRNLPDLYTLEED